MANAEGFDSFYSLLGVPPTASLADIKKAYRHAAIKSHPDKGGDAETFQAVAEAYEVLSDEGKRATYDRFGKAAVRPGGATGGGHRTWAPGTTPQEIFKEMFGDVQDLAALFREMELAAARSGNPNAHNWGATPPPQPVHLSPTPPSLDRVALKALTSELQSEFFSDDLEPPPEATSWRAAEVRTFFERGGDGYAPVRSWGTTAAALSTVGASAPTVPMELWKHPSAEVSGGDAALLTIMEAEDEAALSDVAARLNSDGYVLLTLGLEAALCSQAREEAATTVGAMAPATMPFSSRSNPQQMPRGDAHVTLNRYLAAVQQQLGPGAAAAPVLQGLREALGAVGASLTPLLRKSSDSELQLTEKSDAFLSSVPAGGEAAAHFDSTCTNPNAPHERKLSLTVFLAGGSGGSASGGGGGEQFFDDATGSWRSLPASAETLVLLSLSDRMLRKVVRSAQPSLSMNLYFLGGYVISQQQMQQQQQPSAASYRPPQPSAPSARAPPPPPKQPQPQPARQQARQPVPESSDDDDDSDREGAMDELG